MASNSWSVNIAAYRTQHDEAVEDALSAAVNCSGLSSLPESLGGLGSLQTLDLIYCLGLSSLPESLGGLGSLQTLDLTCCLGLSSLPESLSGLGLLQALNLQNCSELSSFPKSLGGLGLLQTLNLQSCLGVRAELPRCPCPSRWVGLACCRPSI
jgi:hypothetical protein